MAFLWDRIVSPEGTAQTKDDEAFPAKEDADRHASPAELATEGGDRGRHATSPAEIPARGWKDIPWRVYGNIGEHRILALAAGMTYYSLLAISPAIAALVAIYGIFSDPGSIAKHLDDVAGFVPGGAVDVAREQLTRVATRGDQTLGFTFAIGLVTSLWSANAAMKSLFDTLNIVCGEQEKRGFVKLNAISLGFTVGGSVLVLAALGGVVVIPWCCSTWDCLMQRICSSGSDAGPPSSLRWPSRWPASTGSARVARRRGGPGSPGAAPPQRSCGLRLHRCSPSTPPTSAPLTPPMGPWAQSSAS